MRHTYSPLIKIITGTLIVIGLALGVLFIPNLSIFDEQLLPEIKERLNNLPKADINGNAVVYLYGLEAASSLDAKTAGEALLAQLREKHRKGEPANLNEKEAKAIFHGSHFDEAWETLYPNTRKCNPRDQINCIENIMADIQTTPIGNERLLNQIERYRLILQQPHFIEDISYLDFTSPLPAYITPIQLSRLRAADAYLANGLDGLIESTRQDIHFWRLMLKEGQSLIGKMVGINVLRGNLFALSYAMRKEPALTEDQIKNLQSILTPMTNEDIHMERAIEADFYLMVNSIDQYLDVISNAGDTKQLLLNLMAQSNASINLSYQQFYQPAIKLSLLSPTDFYENVQTPAKPFKFSRLNPYNLGGKITMSNPWEYSAYIGRAHDLTGLYTLVQLQLELKINSTDDVITAIKTSTLKNPYTQKPFEYDPNKKELGFRCFDIKDVCHIQI